MIKEYKWQVEYILNDDGDTTYLNNKNSLRSFIKVIKSLNGEILRIRRVIQYKTK